jgi:hypothetical protein
MITRESLFEYQIGNLIKKFKKEWHLEDLNAEELQETIWNNENLARELGRELIELCNVLSDDELFK